MENREKDLLQFAETIRQACVQAALAGHEQAAMDGLCHEGAWENAVEAMRRLDLSQFTQDWSGDQTSSR